MLDKLLTKSQIKKMVYYSVLLGKPIIDRKNKKIGVIKDFSFIDKSRYAIISGIVINIKNSKRIIPWKYVSEIGDKPEDPFPLGIYLNVEFDELKMGDVKDKTLNEVIDKQLMDINGARIIRVNDILLGQRLNSLIIVGVDISTKGLFRRLGLGFLPFKILEQIILWKDVAPLSKDDKNIKLKVKMDRINELHPAEIADMIRDLNLEEKEMFFNSLDKEKAAEALLTSQPDVQKSFFKTLSINKLAKMLETLPNDDAAAILKMMPTVNNVKVLRAMKPGIAAKIQKILSYDKKTAGSLMATRFLTIPENLTIKKAIQYLKSKMPEPKHVFYVYVEGKDKELKGIVSLRDLILSRPEDSISTIINKDIITINEDTDIDDVFNLMSKYTLLALPVLDKDKKIVGVIRINDILEEMIPRKLKKQRIMKHKKLSINSSDLDNSDNGKTKA